MNGSVGTGPAIDAVGLGRMWSATAGLRPVTLAVGAGELVAVRGRSGSGKSTLLALLAGACPPDSGECRVDGGSPDPDMAWSRLALVPQVLALSAELTVREHLTDVAPAGDADGVLARLDLTALARRGITEISMGQRQRLAVARAVVASPRVLLADEPTSFQDGGHVIAVVDELRRVAAHGTAVLMATHDETVVAAADRVVDLS